ncbi:MAG TPA: NifU family protein [Nautiliaceae bacterium]|nr:NifU family protein [Nautiliaceae bacterium]
MSESKKINKEELEKKVKKVLEEIEPALLSHGGGVELVEVTEDGIVKLKLLGACVGCMFSVATLKGFIEEELKNRIPEIKEVIDITEEFDFEPNF